MTKSKFCGGIILCRERENLENFCVEKVELKIKKSQNHKKKYQNYLACQLEAAHEDISIHIPRSTQIDCHFHHSRHSNKPCTIYHRLQTNI